MCKLNRCPSFSLEILINFLQLICLETWNVSMIYIKIVNHFCFQHRFFNLNVGSISFLLLSVVLNSSFECDNKCDTVSYRRKVRLSILERGKLISRRMVPGGRKAISNNNNNNSINNIKYLEYLYEIG